MKLVEEHVQVRVPLTTSHSNDNVVQVLEQKEHAETAEKMLNIFITGATNPMLRLVLPELCNIDFTPKPLGLSIKLFDHYSESKDNAQYIKTLMEEFAVLETPVLKTIEQVQIIGDGLKDCDLFIIADWHRPSV